MYFLRIVLDTNVLVSGLARPESKPGQILQACKEGSVGLILSRYILDEMVRVLPRIVREEMSSTKIRDLADYVMLFAELVEPSTEFEPALRDAKDQLVLGTLRASQADYLITGDKDLLALAEKYPIVTPAAFWLRHGN